MTKKYLCLHSFAQFSVVYIKNYSNCVHVAVANLGNLKRIIHEKLLFLVFLFPFILLVMEYYVDWLGNVEFPEATYEIMDEHFNIFS